MSDLRPEADLLLCCARTRMDRERADRLRALVLGGLDWDYLLRKARPHGLLPLLYTHLNAICPEAVPRDAFERMGDSFRETAGRNLFLTTQLLHLLNLFESNGIAIIPYKGPVLAACVYGDLALRPFDDLDMFVRRRDLPKAMDLLAAEGYQPHSRLTTVQQAAYLASQCEHHFLRNDWKVRLEFQWDLAPRAYGLPFDMEGLWERRVPVFLAETMVLTLSPEDLLPILCLHGYKHFWERLEWICGIGELIRAQPQLDWARVVAPSAALGIERILLLGLSLAHDPLDAALPEEILQKVQNDAEVKRLSTWAANRLFQEPSRPPRSFEAISFRLRARERLGDRLRYCLRRTLTPTLEDWAALPLPDFLFPLYRPLRPIRLAAKYVLGRFRKGAAATAKEK